jgi:hypothetical protein
VNDGRRPEPSSNRPPVLVQSRESLR